MKKIIIALTALAAVSAGAATLKLVVPPAQLNGTPVPIVLPNLDQYKGPQAEITVPDGVTNIAKGKPVTSSDDFPMIGELSFIADGNKDGAEGCYVELMEGVQWVQIDLGAAKDIYAVAMWHFHSQERAYKDVIVQVSDDPKFASGVKTIYNNDHDNSAKLGKGDKKAYIETNYGKLVDVSKTPVKGRYVRLYSNGSTTNGSNHYIEVEVFGK